MFNVPFSTSEFLQILSDYNQAIWPAQIVAYLVGLVAVVAPLRWRGGSGRLVNLALAAFWLMTGIGYHLFFFARINPAANVFGVLFVVQGLIFSVYGISGRKLRFAARRDAYGLVGGLLIVYALLIYPMLGAALGHVYPTTPVFGVTPCPVTIFTFGVLLWSADRVPEWVLIIPGLWALIGSTATLAFGMYEDIALLIAGVLGVGMLLYRNRRLKDSADEGAESQLHRVSSGEPA